MYHYRANSWPATYTVYSRYNRWIYRQPFTYLFVSRFDSFDTPNFFLFSSKKAFTTTVQLLFPWVGAWNLLQSDRAFSVNTHTEREREQCGCWGVFVYYVNLHSFFLTIYCIPIWERWLCCCCCASPATYYTLCITAADTRLSYFPQFCTFKLFRPAYR